MAEYLIPYGKLEIYSYNSIGKLSVVRIIINANRIVSPEDQLQFAKDIDNFARNLLGLSFNTIYDCVINLQYSTNEIISLEEV